MGMLGSRQAYGCCPNALLASGVTQPHGEAGLAGALF